MSGQDMNSGSVHVVVRPGPGIVARRGVGVLVVLDGGTDEVRTQLLEAFEQACSATPTPGRSMARRLVGLLSQTEPDDAPPFGACAPTERGWAVILHQGVALHVEQGGQTTTLSGYEAATWVDRIVDGGFSSMTVVADGADAGPVDQRYRFEGGVIPGGGASIFPTGGGAGSGTSPAQAAPPLSTEGATPAEARPGESVIADPQPVPHMEASLQPEAERQPAAEPVASQPTAPPQPAAAPQPAQPPQPAAQPTAPPQPAYPQQPPTGGLFAPAPTPTGDPGQQPAQEAAGFPGGPAAQADEPPTLIQHPDRGVEPAPVPQQSQPESLPEEDVPFESVPLLDIGPEARRDPLPVLTADTPKEDVEDSDAPLVYGVLSPTGYFNHPDALYCAVTGVSMLHRTHVLVQRPRPPLGVVVADDGSTFTLNKNYIVGREPERDPMVESDQARPLKLQDAERSLSRVHAELRLVDWDIYVVDRGSANGTYVLPRGGEQWKRLVADTPEKIVPGTRVAFGKRVITYESHHQINQAAS